MRHLRRRAAKIPMEVLLNAYAQGCFPMADSETGRLDWYSANPRALLPFNPLHVPRRLARKLRRDPFRYSSDTRFEEVMRACADRDSTWINETLVNSYVDLHEQGFAHSIEVWHDSELVGGLYGVHLGGVFFGESMFNRVDEASKFALVRLAQHLAAREFALLEIQMATSLTAQFEPELVDTDTYRTRLKAALSRHARWWDPAAPGRIGTHLDAVPMALL